MAGHFYMKIIFLTLFSVLSLASMCFAHIDHQIDLDSLISLSNPVVSTLEANEQVKVEIETLTVSDGKVADTIDVILDAESFITAGFDFRIGIDSRYIEILDIIKGETPDSCNWEFFNARKVESNSESAQPQSLWKITGLAKVSPDMSMPLCFSLNRKSSLLRIVVGLSSSIGATVPPDHDAEIFFLWESCRDNIISDQTGQLTLVSKTVRNGLNVSSDDLIIPSSRAGAGDECVDKTRKNHPIRKVDFRNGGIRFEMKVEKK